MRRLALLMIVSAVGLAMTLAPACGDDGDADNGSGAAGSTTDDAASDTAGPDSQDRSGASSTPTDEEGCSPLACEDGNPCTDESCDEIGGCLYALTTNGTPCGCDEGGECLDGSCVGAGQVCTSHLDCDDLLSCTIDLCVGGCACSNEPLADCVEIDEPGNGPNEPPGPDPDPRG